MHSYHQHTEKMHVFVLYLVLLFSLYVSIACEEENLVPDPYVDLQEQVFDPADLKCHQEGGKWSLNILTLFSILDLYSCMY